MHVTFSRLQSSQRQSIGRLGEVQDVTFDRGARVDRPFARSGFNGATVFYSGSGTADLAHAEWHATDMRTGRTRVPPFGQVCGRPSADGAVVEVEGAALPPASHGDPHGRHGGRSQRPWSRRRLLAVVLAGSLRASLLRRHDRRLCRLAKRLRRRSGARYWGRCSSPDAYPRANGFRSCPSDLGPLGDRSDLRGASRLRWLSPDDRIEQDRNGERSLESGLRCRRCPCYWSHGLFAHDAGRPAGCRARCGGTAIAFVSAAGRQAEYVAFAVRIIEQVGKDRRTEATLIESGRGGRLDPHSMALTRQGRSSARRRHALAECIDEAVGFEGADSRSSTPQLLIFRLASRPSWISRLRQSCLLPECRSVRTLGLSLADLARGRQSLDRLCRNGVGATFFPWAEPIPREARKSCRHHPPLCSGPPADASSITSGL